MSNSNLQTPALPSDICKKLKKIKAYLSKKTPSLLTVLSWLAIIYFIVIFYFYVKSDPNDFVWWGDINYQRFSDFGTHVAGIAAIFAFILVFATYQQQLKTNKEQTAYINKKEIQLDLQVSSIKMLVNDNKRQSMSQINQLKTLATHIDSMVQNNQAQYIFAIQEKSFYFLLEHFDTTISRFILLKMKRLGEIQGTIPTSHEIMGRQALNTIYDDFINSLNSSNADRIDLIERVYKINPLFLNEYFNQIRMILEKVSEFPDSSIYIKIFQYMLSDEEKGLILYILFHIEEIPKRQHLIQLIEQYHILDDLPNDKLIDKHDVKNLFAIIKE